MILSKAKTRNQEISALFEEKQPRLPPKEGGGGGEEEKESKEEEEEKEESEEEEEEEKKEKRERKKKPMKKGKRIERTEEEKERATVFVGNVEIGTKGRELKKIFGKHGEVESIRIRGVPVEAKGKEPKEVAFRRGAFVAGRDTMSAFVVFADEEAAREAAKEENNVVFKERHLRVDMAANGGRPSAAASKRSVFVGNLPFGSCFFPSLPLLLSSSFLLLSSSSSSSSSHTHTHTQNRSERRRTEETFRRLRADRRSEDRERQRSEERSGNRVRDIRGQDQRDDSTPQERDGVR